VRYLTLGEVVDIHAAILTQSGGASGIRDLPLLESALAQPKATFGGQDLHATAVEKAAALGFAIVLNHPFMDGNKRVGHAAMEVFLILNGCSLEASVEEHESTMLRLAAGELDREAFAEWLRTRVKKN